MDTFSRILVAPTISAVLSANLFAADAWTTHVPPDQPGKLQIDLHAQRFTTYSFQDDNITRPYFADIFAPSQTKITRNHPPQTGDADDHATMHPGLWLAFGDISGHDYWRLRAPVEHVAFVEDPHDEGNTLQFTVRNRYLDSDRVQTVCTETCCYTFETHDNGVLIVWDSTFESNEHDFTFGDQEEMGLGIRLATPIAVKSKQGGRILNSDGDKNEKGIWGKQADWCDYAGTVDGKFVGIMLMPSPDNFRQCWYHARDYGFVAANPFGRNAFTGGEKSEVVVKQGEPFRLRYGVFIHWHEQEQAFDPNDVYRAFLQRIRSSER